MTKTMNYGAAAATIAALTMSVFAALPASAFACGGYCGGSNDTDINNSVKIEVENSGTITSVTGSISNTGGNTADGSYAGSGGKGGSGGDGGKAEADDGSHHCDCDPSVGNATGGDGGMGGNGGAGGNGGPGGLVDTGDAEANAGSLNTLNSTEIDVQAADCGCGSNDHQSHGWGRNRGDTDINNSVKVEVENDGTVTSLTGAGANSGLNAAGPSVGGNGAKGGSGGDGGKAESGQGVVNYDWHAEGGNAYGGRGGDAGEGGNGGDGDVGGTVRTGRAESNAGSINVMNSTIVRVTR